jgi:hypothetical protein
MIRCTTDPRGKNASTACLPSIDERLYRYPETPEARASARMEVGRSSWACEQLRGKKTAARV